MGRSYAVIGTGAIGGYYGGLLARAGNEVHFLFHRDGPYVRKHGLVVDSVTGNFTLKTVNAYDRAEDMPRCDTIIIALKATANRALATILPHIVHRDSVIVLLQNGLGGEEYLATLALDSIILGGLCFICTTKVGPGHIRHIDYGKMTLSEYRPDGTAAGVTTAVNQHVEAFRAAGIDVTGLDDLVLARWKKMVWNIPFNGLSVLCSARTDALVSHASSREVVIQLMNEVARGAAAFGREITQDFIDKNISMTETMKPYKPSMRLDYDQHRPMEVEAIYGEAWRRARAAGVELAGIGLLYRMLSFLQDVPGNGTE